MRANKTNLIQEHYDLVSKYYQKLWSKNIHHGYYLKGNESKRKASQNLTNYLISKMKFRKNSKVLDIGCGVGGVSNYLAKKYDCDVLGITISPEQVKMAEKNSIGIKNKPNFVVQDANYLSIDGKFDYIFSIEMISHLHNRKEFFNKTSRLLKSDSEWAIAAWTKNSNLSLKQKKIIKDIEEGMLVSLPDMKEYSNYFKENKLQVIFSEDISDKVQKTWDICFDTIKNPKLWSIARKYPKEVIHFLRTFVIMRKGFKSGAFRYILMVVKR